MNSMNEFNVFSKSKSKIMRLGIFCYVAKIWIEIRPVIQPRFFVSLFFLFETNKIPLFFVNVHRF